MPEQPDIFVAIGANLPSPAHGAPLGTCRAALPAMTAAGVRVVACARWYRSRPFPSQPQPDYVNGVVRVSTPFGPEALLAALHAIEATFGRVRGERDAARILDLDLIAYGDRVSGAADGLVLPHPRMHERAFVLRPLSELAPTWRHPRLGVGIDQLLSALPESQVAIPLEPGDEPRPVTSLSR